MASEPDQFPWESPTASTASTSAAAKPDHQLRATSFLNDSPIITLAPARLITISACSEPCRLSAGIITRLNITAPMIAPIDVRAVDFADHCRPESAFASLSAAQASVIGKLAPHSGAAGKIGRIERADIVEEADPGPGRRVQNALPVR